MKCALCKIADADKSNTHLLTDSIIRSCLNMDGASDREKGFYFDLSSNMSSIEYSFQRETSVDELEKRLGREPTDEEIERAKQNPYSVDNIFCTACEKIFTDVETSFTTNILPKLRTPNLDGRVELKFKEVKTIRVFFYIQLWRTHICTDIFNINDDIADRLRELILKHETLNIKEINKFPLAVNYLNTNGGDKEYTRNLVGFTDDSNPYILIMNDFVVQFYEDEKEIRFFDFHDINENDNYIDYINFGEDEFRIKIVTDAKRKEFAENFIFNEKVKNMVEWYRSSFIKLWFTLFGGYPGDNNINDYISELINNDVSKFLKYSKEEIAKLTTGFIKRRTCIENNKDSFRKLPSV